ncbi:Type 1 glutamine amidotransferase-like domain-containing protein [Phaeodactylibacter luteus]|uniref:Cyanophycinase n=1 Tax=Phaeodactylibacter luteus TaxID=1564516 RepID=A0A5C6RTA4_9BACT|nr:Type 1 glutamine amidotransferase-like domain-containing protein [Phaeodactylibacter luteus]TXB65581.1 cyanophycinase [Phaeodactylibacter luteus]
MRLILLASLCLLAAAARTQSYTSFFTGDTTDVATTTVPGIVLAGGGGDNDEAMQWMLQRAGGGDVVVIRASGADGYNDYFFEDLGVDVNSVETIRFESAAASTDEYVIQQIRNAECLFIAGGDQYDYYSYWQGNAIGEAINYLLNEKGVPVGGTSAGMAILGGWYYAPSGSALTAEEALSDPFHPDFEVLGQGDFLQAPYLSQIITDTHYEQRERPGRHLAFLARMLHAGASQAFGIAANEYTAVCIDEQGTARAFGEYPAYAEDLVYFLQANCQDERLPEAMQAGQPLTWDRGQSAVKAYALPARPGGAGAIDLASWSGFSGGSWENWYVTAGELHRVQSPNGDCADILSTTEYKELPPQTFRISPNPARGQLQWQGPQPEHIRIYGLTGQLKRSWAAPTAPLPLGGLPAGAYLLEAVFQGKAQALRLLVY